MQLHVHEHCSCSKWNLDTLKIRNDDRFFLSGILNWVNVIELCEVYLSVACKTFKIIAKYFRFDKNEKNLMQFKPKLADCKLKFIFVFVFAVFAHMMIMFVPVRPPCPACLRVHCLQTKMQIHDRVSGFSRKIEQIIDPAPLVTNPVEKFIFPAKRFHLARRHLPLQRLQARQDEVGFVKQNFQKVT